MASNRKIIEKGMQEKLTERNKKLEEFFEVEEHDFEMKDRNSDLIYHKKKPIVFCKDKEQFIAFVAHWRRVKNPLLKIMIDGGGSFLKVSLSVIDVAVRFEEESRVNTDFLMEEVKNEKKRSSYKDGVAPKANLDTSVKKVFVLAIAPEVPERYENLKTVLGKIGMESMNKDEVALMDLKASLPALGISPSHRAIHCCILCEWDRRKPFTPARLRTFGSLKEHYKVIIRMDHLNSEIFHYGLLQRFCEDGKPIKRAQEYMNVINPSLINGADEDLVMDIVNCPELHIMEGKFLSYIMLHTKLH